MTSDPALPQFGDPVGPWHSHFAWYPVRSYDRRFIWFRRCLRRAIQKHHYLDGGSDFWWQYKL